MRRLQLTDFGEPANVVVLDETSEPKLSEDQLLVKMEAAAMNPSDFYLIEGNYGVRPDPPFNVGSEGVGRVAKAGQRARHLQGKRVLILPTYEQGTWAEETVVAQDNVVELSDKGDALQLAMIGVNPATAYLLLKDYTHLMPGDWVGQTAANGATGQYIIQLAKLAGLKTLNVVRRPEAADQVRAFGGDQVVLQDQDLSKQIEQALEGEELAVAFDGVGGAPIGELTKFLRPGGITVAYSLQSGELPRISPPLDIIFRGLSLHGFWLINWIRNAPRDEVRRTYQHLAGLVTEGKLFAQVEATYPLDRYQDAFARAQKPLRSGKILFRF